MMVFGPSRSGKTYWVADLLLTRNARIDAHIPKVRYCYAHWQEKYENMKYQTDGISFHQGLSSSDEIEEMSDGLIVIDDLVNDAVKDASMLSTFTEGSHHKNISIVFIMQNIFHKGSHTRTMSINTQYIVFFKNPRDEQQIQTLARQVFGRNSEKLMSFYRQETNKLFWIFILVRRSVNEFGKTTIRYSMLRRECLSK